MRRFVRFDDSTGAAARRHPGFMAMGLLLLAFSSDATAAPSNIAIWRHDGLQALDPTGFQPGQPNPQGIGASVATAGDFNCDGVSDLLLGSPSSDYVANGTLDPTFSPPDADHGWIGIYFGGRSLPPQPTGAPDWVAVGDIGFGPARSGLGSSVAAGDVNGDGCDDVVALAVGTESNEANNPSVRVYFGSATGPSTSFSWRRDIGTFGPFAGGVDGTPYPRLGVSVTTGDLDRDGTAEIIVGNRFANLTRGVVLVWMGSLGIGLVPDGANDPDWVARGVSSAGSVQFGTSVSAGGDVNGDGFDDLVVGDFKWGPPGLPGRAESGIAYLWLGKPGFASTPDGTPLNPDRSFEGTGGGNHLGWSVAIAGDVDRDGLADILTGEPGWNNIAVAGASEGRVLVTRGASPAPVSNSLSWTHDGSVVNGRLGYAVASAGDANGDGFADYLIGEPGFDGVPPVFGRAHLVLGRTTWPFSPAADVTYTQPNLSGSSLANNRYGAHLGTAGDWNDDGFSDIVIASSDLKGSAFVYAGRGESVGSNAAYFMTDVQPGAALGIGLAMAGDINHDGYSDVVTAAPHYESGAAQTDEGRLFVAYGGSCGPTCGPQELTSPGQREGNQAGAQLGYSLSSAGDVNGDGYADVIAGAPLYDGQATRCPFGQTCPVFDSGAAQVFLGGQSGLATSPAWAATGATQANAQFGFSAANAGDVNGDGYGDIIVGAPYNDFNGSDSGRVYLYLGSASGLSTVPTWSKTGSGPNVRLGFDLAGAGDVNGDGFSDVIIGAPGQGANGSALIYLGRPTTPLFPQGLWNTPIRTLTGNQAGSSFGQVVAGVGDLNRDGLADVAVGAPTLLDDPELGPQIGAVTVYHGAAPAGPSTTPSTSLFGAFPDQGSASLFGFGVSAAGDVDGDGYDDLLVGDPWHAGPTGFAEGAAYVYHGRATGIPSFAPANRTLDGCAVATCDFGRDVAGAGDVNGDGFSDIAVGAYSTTVSTGPGDGAIFVHLGNEGRGTPFLPRQSLEFGGAPRAILGAASPIGRFDALLHLVSPAGRARVQLELEVKALGVDFDGENRLTGEVLDNVNTPASNLTYLDGIPNSTHVWRARVRSFSPNFGRSRWISLPGNGARELDIRVVPEPGLGLGLFAGAAAIAACIRTRRAPRRT